MRTNGVGAKRRPDTIDYDHVGLHVASSIDLRSQYAATQAGQSMQLRINVPGFDAVCRMVQVNMSIVAKIDGTRSRKALAQETRQTRVYFRLAPGSCTGTCGELLMTFGAPSA